MSTRVTDTANRSYALADGHSILVIFSHNNGPANLGEGRYYVSTLTKLNQDGKLIDSIVPSSTGTASLPEKVNAYDYGLHSEMLSDIFLHQNKLVVVYRGYTPTEKIQVKDYLTIFDENLNIEKYIPLLSNKIGTTSINKYVTVSKNLYATGFITGSSKLTASIGKLNLSDGTIENPLALKFPTKNEIGEIILK